MKVESKKNINPTYRYFSIRKDLAVNPTELSRPFMYIGQNEENHSLLQSECFAGIAEANLLKAKSSLNKMNQSGIIPAVIFVDLPLELKELQAFCIFIQGNEKLSRVPVIMNIRNLGKNDIACLKAVKLVDELVDFKVELASIRQKIDFISKVKHELIDRKGSIKPEFKASGVYKQQNLVKRVLDILISVSFLIILMPVYFLIALAIKFETRGPILYKSYRAGKGYKIFKFYKFRTMRVGAERMINSIAHLNKYNNFGHAPVFFKVDNDPRITKVGQFLRNSGLDELPQFLNVLIGDMSIVGNRPLPLYEASSLTSNEWAERFSAPAGITGLWQVNCKNRQPFTCYDRIIMDIEYSKTSNIFMDFGIMVRTPYVLIQGLIQEEQTEPQYHSMHMQPELSQV